MSAFWAIDLVCLAMILTSAVLVVRIRNLNGAVMALSAVGVVLSLLFVVLGAPDVAHSEVVVGAIALPVLYLVAIGKVRVHVPDVGDYLGERGERVSGEDSDGGNAADERPG